MPAFSLVLAPLMLSLLLLCLIQCSSTTVRGFKTNYESFDFFLPVFVVRFTLTLFCVRFF